MLTEDEALRYDDGWGVPNVFLLGRASCAMHHRAAPGKAKGSYPASYDMARRSESGLRGGWGTTLLCVPAQRPYVPGYAPYLARLDKRPSAENGEAGPNYRALFASTVAGWRQG